MQTVDPGTGKRGGGGPVTDAPLRSADIGGGWRGGGIRVAVWWVYWRPAGKRRGKRGAGAGQALVRGGGDHPPIHPPNPPPRVDGPSKNVEVNSGEGEFKRGPRLRQF